VVGLFVRDAVCGSVVAVCETFGLFFNEDKMKTTKQTYRVLEDVIKERKYQDKKWGEQNHYPFKYNNILGEEFGEACKAANEAYDWKNGYWSKSLKHYRKELIQVAAVAVAIVECLDRGKWCK